MPWRSPPACSPLARRSARPLADGSAIGLARCPSGWPYRPPCCCCPMCWPCGRNRWPEPARDRVARASEPWEHQFLVEHRVGPRGEFRHPVALRAHEDINQRIPDMVLLVAVAPDDLAHVGQACRVDDRRLAELASPLVRRPFALLQDLEVLVGQDGLDALDPAL